MKEISATGAKNGKISSNISQLKNLYPEKFHQIQSRFKTMGKIYPEEKQLVKEMSGEIYRSTGTEISLGGEHGDIQTVRIFGSFEDVDSLKKYNKSLHPGLERLQNDVSVSESEEKLLLLNTSLSSANSFELSTSLPNLCDGFNDTLTSDQCSVNGQYDQISHSSYTDIHNSPTRPHKLLSISNECHTIKTLKDNALSTSADSGTRTTLVHSSASSLKDKVSDKETDGDIAQSKSSQDLHIRVNKENNGLSAVLANIPLVYIPHSKKLIPAKPDHTHTSNPGPSIPAIIPVNQSLDSSKCANDMPNLQSSVLAESQSTLTQGSVTDLENYDEIADELSSLTCESDSPGSTLARNNNTCSLTRAEETSSYGSVSSFSTGTDFSASASINSDFIENKLINPEPDESGFVEINLNGRNSYEKSRNSSQDSGIDAERGGTKPKRKNTSGFTSFLSRSLFSRKKETGTQGQGWKLFGKVPPKQNDVKDANEISDEYRRRYEITESLRKNDVEAPSTTALILENRPQNLPSKSPEEELRHRLEYEAMIETARRKELKEMKLRKKQMALRLRQEEMLKNAIATWNDDILPNWDTMKDSKKAREMWFAGIPPCVRGKVWKLAIGNDLNLTEELYEICLNRAKDRIRMMDTISIDSSHSFQSLSQEPASSKESSVELIKLDVSRTFPQLCIFQKGGPYHELLHDLLSAYTCYRPDVGYVQGMSFIAAILLLNMEVIDAFLVFANLLNKPCQVAFFRMDELLIKSYFQTYDELVKENLPKLHQHFQVHNLTPDLYIIDWIFTLYSKSLPLDVASRVWDVFCRDGEEFLFRTALGILKMYEETLMTMEFIHLAQYLTKLPEDINGDILFRCIESIHMSIDKRKFSLILATNKESICNSCSKDRDSDT
ncbi:unnamed protein product [Owenia fusiformis]|uniref:Rab-GAP TBC domain-containing protein n=1 Tax=Owenia fusiformis TaxID=6347 RepID=A0A8S4NPA9_OWEFU|nr:unnamed protein product [Owenia fusiformis]